VAAARRRRGVGRSSTRARRRRGRGMNGTHRRDGSGSRWRRRAWRAATPSSIAASRRTCCGARHRRASADGVSTRAHAALQCRRRGPRRGAAAGARISGGDGAHPEHVARLPDVRRGSERRDRCSSRRSRSRRGSLATSS
jgi:hypothetical protein